MSNLERSGLDYSAANNVAVVLLGLSFVVITGITVGNYFNAKKNKDFTTSFLFIFNWVFIAMMTYVSVMIVILNIIFADFKDF